jgi:hypothetical protein
LLATDWLLRIDPTTLSTWQRWLTCLGGAAGPEGSTPLDWRIPFWIEHGEPRPGS